MYNCTSCGGNLHFDIATQKLKCEYCSSFYTPSSFGEKSDAEDSTSFETTIFTCPHCGGEIISAENSAAGFCSFCGSSVVLSSRLATEKRPDYVIPFQKTMEDCRDIYAASVKHMIYAPKELKDAKYLTRFRGLYMPYWDCTMSCSGPVAMRGKKSENDGVSITHTAADISCTVHATCPDILFDASSAFNDNLSDALLPFDASSKVPFFSSYLCGFYADLPDVPVGSYIDGMAEEYSTEVKKETQQYTDFYDYKADPPIDSESNGPDIRSFPRVQTRSDKILLPLWFLSYQKNGRVAYAVVNGQTGSIAADLPVDRRKVLLSSLLLSVPAFFLLNLSGSHTAMDLLLFSILISVCGIILYLYNMHKIYLRENRINDKGFQVSVPEKEHIQIKKLFSGKLTVCMAAIFFASYGLTLCQSFFNKSVPVTGNHFGTTLFLVAVMASVSSIAMMTARYLRLVSIRSFLFEFMSTVFAILFSCVLYLLYPVSDLYYYGCTMLLYLCSCSTLFGIIGKYNVLATRPIPEFHA